MRLYRFALVSFESKIEPPLDLVLSIGGDESFGIGHLHKTKVDGTYILPAAHIVRYRPKVTKSNLIVFPRKIRERLEQAIVEYANLVSVSLNCGRTIWSGNPVIAVFPENQDDLEYLSRMRGFCHSAQSSTTSKGSYAFNLSVHLHELSDRHDGAMLLAEALSAKTATGQVHEFIRFFERAFGTSGRKLIDPMCSFLSVTFFNYNRDEIENWIDLRDSATHADKRNELAYAIDSSWKTARLEQAAYDILLNKLHWRSASSDRRHSWIPINGTVSADNDFFLKKGFDQNWTMQIYDAFRKFPLHAAGGFDLRASGFWCGPLLDEKRPDLPENIVMQSGGTMHVIAEDDIRFFIKEP